MRIYSDPDLNVLYIEGVSQGPVDSYSFTVDEGLVSALRPASGIYDFIGVPWTAITNKQAVGFQSVTDLAAYLTRLIVPQFPLRFTVSDPLVIMGNDVELDPQFIKNLANLDSGYA